jgi:DNA-binding HxlR family transcriptional regulator
LVAKSNLASKGRDGGQGSQRLHGIRGDEVRSGPLELDRLIHERMRLAIVSALAVNQSLSFNELKRLLETTDGNLSVHARKLEEANYIVCTKSFEGRVPRTEYRLSSVGRRALERYLDHMEALIHSTRER